ncbi:MAG: 3',5'-cyclic-nucleotide phosphodiesterase [Pseudomonadota bacterium]
MKIRVLGCSGGIGDGRHSTAFLVDDDILVDCGTGVTRLSHVELCRIDHVFLTHGHLDHILCLPLLLDSAAGERSTPVTVHGLPEVLQTLRDHIFNWRVWPDFARIPTPDTPFLRYQEMALGEARTVAGRTLTSIPANHVVPAVGYRVACATGSWVFSGDTASHEALWRMANQMDDLRHLVVECSFQDAQAELAQASKHYHPAALAADLHTLKPGVQAWITHLKPGGEADIMAELLAHGLTDVCELANDQVFEL